MGVLGLLDLLCSSSNPNPNGQRRSTLNVQVLGESLYSIACLILGFRILFYQVLKMFVWVCISPLHHTLEEQQI